MKNKIFNLVALIFLLGSLTSMNVYNEDTAFKSCTDGTFDAMDAMLDLGFSAAEAGCVGNYFYAECTGWPVTLQNYQDCTN